MAQMWPVVCARGIETHSVILNDELYSAIQAVKRNAGLAGVRMSCDIPQCLLCDTKQAKCRILRKRLGHSIRFESDLRRPEFREPRALGFQRFTQAKIFKY